MPEAPPSPDLSSWHQLEWDNHREIELKWTLRGQQTTHPRTHTNECSNKCPHCNTLFIWFLKVFFFLQGDIIPPSHIMDEVSVGEVLWIYNESYLQLFQSISLLFSHSFSPLCLFWASSSLCFQGSSLTINSNGYNSACMHIHKHISLYLADKTSQVKSSHLYLYSAFNNTNCNKALHNIKIGK